MQMGITVTLIFTKVTKSAFKQCYSLVNPNAVLKLLSSGSSLAVFGVTSEEHVY